MGRGAVALVLPGRGRASGSRLYFASRRGAAFRIEVTTNQVTASSPPKAAADQTLNGEARDNQSTPNAHIGRDNGGRRRYRRRAPESRGRNAAGCA